MLTKKQISVVYMDITFMMLFGVQQSEKSCSVQEVGNVKDRYAISVLQGSDVVRHLPQMISGINKSGSWNIM